MKYFKEKKLVYIYNTHFEVIFLYLIGKLKDHNMAKNITQEVFIDFFKEKKQIKNIRNHLLKVAQIKLSSLKQK